VLGIVVLSASILWSYWPSWESMAHEWAHDPVYSHGYLVPAFALILLWSRRQKAISLVFDHDWLGGCILLTLASINRLAGAYFYFPWLETVSILPCLAGICLLLAGRSAFAWSWPAIAFLFFMMPLPYSLETGMKQPLQRIATQGSTYVLQTLGCPAFAEGNIIVLKDKRLGVEEACSGLSMLLVFFALTTAMALMIRRPLWEKCLLLLSAAPIAVIANVGRITLTGFLYQQGRSREAQLVFHDLAGWLMIPAGLLLIGIELIVLSRLMVTLKARQPLPLILAQSSSPPSYGTSRNAANRRQRQRT
jgi:exosortase